MRKMIVVAILVALVGVMAVPLMASAATFVNIGITATGSDISITCNRTDWAAGSLSPDEVAMTSDNDSWGLITNLTSEAVDVSIHGHNMTGGAVTWTLSDTGAHGAGIVGMQFALHEAAYAAIPVTPSALMINELPAVGGSNTQAFGLWIEAPSSGVGNEAMTMASSGLYLEATID